MQTADTPADYNAMDEAVDSSNLQVHPYAGAQAAQVLSASRRGFDTASTNDYMNTDHASTISARRDSKAKAPSFDLPIRTASSVEVESGPERAPKYKRESHDMDFVEKLQSLMQGICKCRRCHHFYDLRHNEVGDCQSGHSGTFTLFA